MQFKGGVMCLILRRENLNEACSYRGILLLATSAKRIHGMLRSNLMATLGTKRVEGQLGGFSRQMVRFGFQSLFLHGHTFWRPRNSVRLFFTLT